MKAGWLDPELCLQSAVLQLPGLTQVRWGHYGPEYRDPQIDKEYYCPWQKLKRNLNRELRKTQCIRAAPVMKTSSVFEDPLISTFTDVMVKGGNKLLARYLITQTLEAENEAVWEVPCRQQATIECNPYTIFHQALKNWEPVIGLWKRGHFCQVPVLLAHQRPWSGWLLSAGRIVSGRMLMPEKLFRELLEAFHNQRPVVTWKHDMPKMANTHHALAHNCWW